MVTNRSFAALIFTAVLFFSAFPAFADKFSGMVIDYSVYNVIVKQGDKILVFQIRPETHFAQNSRDPHPQDLVSVKYHQDKTGAALVADEITIDKRYKP